MSAGLHWLYKALITSRLSVMRFMLVIPLNDFEELRKDALLHFPVDTHGLIACRGNIIHQTETIEGAGVAKAILFILSDEQ